MVTFLFDRLKHRWGMQMASLLRYDEWTLKRKLFACMFLLTVILLSVLMSGMLMLGRFNSTSEAVYESLDMQMEVFEKDITVHFEHLAAASIHLSEDMTAIVEAQLASSGQMFSRLTDSPEQIGALQEAMLEPMKQKLLQTHASGIFVMLDATVNSTLPHAASSRTGIYLQVNGYKPSDSDILMYRGITAIGKAHGITPHRKWRLELSTELIPFYAEAADTSRPISASYRLTEQFTLPGTSEQAVLMTVPLRGTDGTFFGICGYEISESYFMTYHAQPSKLPHLSCLLTTGTTGVIRASRSLSCGVTGGYFRAFRDDFAIKKAKHDLLRFDDGTHTYLGITKQVSLSSGEDIHTLAVLIPRSDYDRDLYKSTLQVVILLILLMFFTVNCCLFFSRRFLSPILRALELIKSDKRTETASKSPEIVDLFEYLARKDKEYTDTVSALVEKNQTTESEKSRLQTEYSQALAEFRRVQDEYTRAQDDLMKVQTEIDRLAYSRKTEIDPDDYQNFLLGLKTLTASEREIFEYYLSGKSAKEILELTGTKESTLKYHNHNILGKLGVSSRKQMLRYAAVMKQQGEEGFGK